MVGKWQIESRSFMPLDRGGRVVAYRAGHSHHCRVEIAADDTPGRAGRVARSSGCETRSAGDVEDLVANLHPGSYQCVDEWCHQCGALLFVVERRVDPTWNPDCSPIGPLR